MPNVRDVPWRIRAAWAFAVSVFKRDWTLDDYPVRVGFRPLVELAPGSRFKPHPWRALVFNWPAMFGSGVTKNEALEELRRNFEQFKASNESLPRPGVKVPIEFAACDRVDRHGELASIFLKRVFGMDSVWISDESTLWDFHTDETNENLANKIKAIYGVDVSDISSGNLADIFDRIAEHQPFPPSA